jgi:8-oxo-dGTP diphosphatase
LPDPARFPLLVAAAALVDADGRVLVQRRPPGKQHADLWEFPGGKLEPGETAEAALARELREELGIGVAAADLLPVAFASEPGGARPLLLLLFAARRWRGVPVAHAASALCWTTAAGLSRLPMPPADVPLQGALHRWIASSPS